MDFDYYDWLGEVINREPQPDTTPNFQKQRKDKDVFFSKLLGKKIKVVEWIGPGRCENCAYADCCVRGVYNLLNFRKFEAGRCSYKTRIDGKNIMFESIENTNVTDSELLRSLSDVSIELERLGESAEEIVNYQNLLLETYLSGKSKDGN